MKNLKQIISEKLVINKHSKVKFSIQTIEDVAKKYNLKEREKKSDGFYVYELPPVSVKENFFQTLANKSTNEKKKITDLIWDYVYSLPNCEYKDTQDLRFEIDHNFSGHYVQVALYDYSKGYRDIQLEFYIRVYNDISGDPQIVFSARLGIESSQLKQFEYCSANIFDYIASHKLYEDFNKK